MELQIPHEAQVFICLVKNGFLVNVGGGKDLTTAICPLKETKDLRKKINCFFLELAQI